MKKIKVTIFGAGNIGTSLAYHIGKQGHPVTMYCIEPDVLKQINRKHRNKKYLRKIKLPHTIKADSDLHSCLQGADVIISALPSHAAKIVFNEAKNHIEKHTIIACITKGLDPDTLSPIAVMIQKMLPKSLGHRVCMLGGPAIAGELVKNQPAAFMVASNDAKARSTMASLLAYGQVKTSTSHDLLGVSLGAALKNPYAIAMGFCDGLKYPTNTKALVITMAIQEMSEIMLRAGADPDTASSLSGLGDLLVTGLAPNGHNRSYGQKLIKAKTNNPGKLGFTIVEGIDAARHGLRLADRLKADTPLLKAIHKGINLPTGYHKPFEQYLHNLKLN
jgi:glycerol-3-phosphate dehydrogenase (NAD(P)+)